MKNMILRALSAALLVMVPQGAAFANQTVSKNYNLASQVPLGRSPALRLVSGKSATYALAGTFVQTLVLDTSNDGKNWVATGVTATSTTASGTIYADQWGTLPGKALLFSWHISSYTSGSSTLTFTDSDDLVQAFPNHYGTVNFKVNDYSVFAASLNVSGGISAGPSTFTFVYGDLSGATGAVEQNTYGSSKTFTNGSFQIAGGTFSTAAGLVKQASTTITGTLVVSGTVTVTGSGMSVAGPSTATFFYGNGSALTGVGGGIASIESTTTVNSINDAGQLTVIGSGSYTGAEVHGGATVFKASVTVLGQGSEFQVNGGTLVTNAGVVSLASTTATGTFIHLGAVTSKSSITVINAAISGTGAGGNITSQSSITTTGSMFAKDLTIGASLATIDNTGAISGTGLLNNTGEIRSNKVSDSLGGEGLSLGNNGGIRRTTTGTEHWFTLFKTNWHTPMRFKEQTAIATRNQIIFSSTTVIIDAAEGDVPGTQILRLSSGAAGMFIVDNYGHFSSSAAVNAAVGTCTNGTLVQPANDRSGYITFSGANTSCSINFANTYGRRPNCSESHQIASFLGIDTTITATSITFTSAVATIASGDSISYICEFAGK